MYAALNPGTGADHSPAPVRTSKTLQELPDQQRDSDQEQIRNESTDNHHMRAEQSAYKAEQYGKRSRHRDCDP